MTSLAFPETSRVQLPIRSIPMRTTPLLTIQWLFALLLLMGSCAAPPLPEPTAPEDDTFPQEEAPAMVLGANDVLQVVIPGHPELTTVRGYSVSVAGAIILPLCGPVQVAGFGLEEAEKRIREALGEYIVQPGVGLSVLTRASQRIHLLGQLRRPGVMDLERPTTAIEALAHGGGFEFGARRDRVALIRRDAQGGCDVYFFNGETPGPDSLRWIHPGDVLFVPRSGVGVFRDEILPILQGIGFATSQVAAVAIAAETF